MGLSHEELDGAGAAVVHLAREGEGLLSHGLARRLVQHDGGRLLQHLLVPALHRALALVEVHAVPVPVAQHLPPTRSA